MRKTNNKGQTRVIEAILASIIVVFALAFVNTFTVSPSSPALEPSELEKIAYNVLHGLDEQRLLSRLVYNEEWTNLTTTLMASLAPNIYFSLTVYDTDGQTINTEQILYGDPQIFQTSSSIASVSYGVPGYQANYEPRILTLKLVRA